MATSRPASAAPPIDDGPLDGADRPETRSSDQSAVRAISGIIAALPASPGPRSAPATATSTSRVGKDSIPRPCSSGIAATTNGRHQVARQGHPPRPDPVEQRAAERLEETSGVISAAATRPVWVAEPVVESTNHGIAIIETRVPTKEMPSATSAPARGARGAHDARPTAARAAGTR